MKCPNCGTDNRPGAKFCTKCQARLPVASQGGQQPAAAQYPQRQQAQGGQQPVAAQYPQGQPPRGGQQQQPASPPYQQGQPPRGGQQQQPGVPRAPQYPQGPQHQPGAHPQQAYQPQAQGQPQAQYAPQQGYGGVPGQSPAQQQRRPAKKKAFPWKSLFAMVGILILGMAIGLGSGYLIFGGNASGGAAPVVPTTVSTAVLPTPTPVPEVNVVAPDFSLPDEQDNAVSLSSRRDKVAVLVFWTNMNPASLDLLNTLNALKAEYAPDAWDVLAVNMGNDKAVVTQLKAGHGWSFPVLLDKDNRVNAIYRVDPNRAVFFVDKAGVIRDIRAYTLTKDEVRGILEGLLG